MSWPDRVAVDSALQVIPETLAVIPGIPQIVSVLVQAGLTTWQQHQLGQQLQQIEFKLKTLDQKKLDRVELHEDRFKNLIYELLRAGAHTESEFKRGVLANAFGSACVQPTSRDQLRGVYARMIGFLTPEEIQVLTVCPHDSFGIFDVLDRLDMDVDDAHVVLEALKQQGLMEPAEILETDSPSSRRFDLRWRRTVLAGGLINYCRSSDSAEAGA